MANRTAPTEAPPAQAVSVKPIVFGTDFSPASTAAFDKAVELAKKEGAELVIAHVYEPPADMSHSGLADDVITADLEEKIRKDVETQLDHVVAKARAAGVPNVRGVVLSGHASERLSDLAARTGAEMLILGTHGRTGLRKILTGSVASKAIVTSPCPVLTVH